MKKLQQRNKLDYNESFETFQCIILAGLGYNIRLIEELTGLTRNQQNYILKSYKIKRFDYRNGKSHVSKLIRNLAGKKLQTIILSSIKQLK